MRTFFILFLCLKFSNSIAQLQWRNVDDLYQPLPKSIHLYYTDQPIDTGKFRAYYLIADLHDKQLDFTVDTSRDRRLIPDEFYKRNGEPLVVVNTTFFSYGTNHSLNAVIKDGELVAYNIHTVYGRGKDTFTYRHPFSSAIGISKKRTADVAWVYTDSTNMSIRNIVSISNPAKDSNYSFHPDISNFQKWKMQTAVGGGPVLLQDGMIRITNEEELKFAGKAIHDKHPRTAMGYTADGKIIILMVEGRNKNAGGATLTQMAQIFKDLGCKEAINLDGGGSSCMLVNGKKTIRPSDLVERPVPAVFIIKKK